MDETSVSLCLMEQKIGQVIVLAEPFVPHRFVGIMKYSLRGCCAKSTITISFSKGYTKLSALAKKLRLNMTSCCTLAKDLYRPLRRTLAHQRATSIHS